MQYYVRQVVGYITHLNKQVTELIAIRLQLWNRYQQI